MTELALRPATSPAALVEYAGGEEKFRRLLAWSEAAKGAYVIAEQLVRTGFVPEAFRGKPNDVMAAILAGLELGFEPMASLRSFDLINGIAAPRAMTLRAVVLNAGHHVRIASSTVSRAVVQGRRKGEQSENDWQTSTWTMERAAKLGLAGKKNWIAQPDAMLVARATSEVCRWIGADAILGIPYSAEELADGDLIGVQATIAAASEQPPRKMARKRAEPAAKPEPVAPAEPEFDDTPMVLVEPEPEPAAVEPDMDEEIPPITTKQRNMLYGLLKETGREDRDVALVWLSGVVGREINSTADLSILDATAAISMMRAELQR